MPRRDDRAEDATASAPDIWLTSERTADPWETRRAGSSLRPATIRGDIVRPMPMPWADSSAMITQTGVASVSREKHERARRSCRRSRS